MREIRSGPRFRRGAIVALDGLAIWLLAVVFATYVPSDPAARLETGLYATVRATMTTWYATPGAAPFELLAYAGLAIAVLGPAWYWGVRWVLRLPATKGAPPDLASEFEPVDSPERSSSRPERPAPVTSEPQPKPQTRPRSPSADWVHEVFEDTSPKPTAAGPMATEPGPGDFLRSPGGSGHTTTDGGWGESPADPAESKSGLHAALGESISAADSETNSSIPADTTDEAADPEPRPDADEAVADEDSAAEPVPADDTPAGSTDPEPADPLERLAAEIDASASAIESASETVRRAVADAETALAAMELPEPNGDADGALRALRNHDPNGVRPLDECVHAIRANQRRLESAFRTELADD